MRLTLKTIGKFLFLKNKKNLFLALFLLSEASFILYAIFYYLNHGIADSWYNVIYYINAPVTLLLLTLIAIFLILAICGYRINLSSLRSCRQVTFILLFILLGAVLLRFQTPTRHYFFHDEDFSLHYAQMINENGRIAECNLGIYEDEQLNCSIVGSSEIQIKQGHPVVLAVLFRMLGNSELAAFLLNIFLGVLSVLLVFFIGKEIWSVGAGLLSASLMAVFPSHIWFSATTSTEVPSLFFLLSGLLVFLLFLRIKKYALLVLSFLLIAYAAYTRPEMILAFPFLITFILINKEFRGLALRSWKNIIMTMTVSLFVVFQIILAITSLPSYIVNSTIEQSLGRVQDGSLFSLEYVGKNTAALALHNFSIRDYFIAILMGAAIFGIYQLTRKSWRVSIVFVGIPFTLFFVSSSYLYADIEPHIMRFALIWMTPLVIIAGVGLDVAGKKISKWFVYHKLQKKILPTLPLFTFLPLALYAQIHLEDLIPVDWNIGRIREIHAMENFQEKNPQCLYVDAVVIRHIFKGYNAISYNEFSTISAEKKLIVDRQPCVIFFEGLDCKNEDNNFRKACDSILSSNSWNKLSYNDIITWQLIRGSQEEDIALSVPESTALSFRPASVFETIANKFSGVH